MTNTNLNLEKIEKHIQKYEDNNNLKTKVLKGSIAAAALVSMVVPANSADASEKNNTNVSVHNSTAKSSLISLNASKQAVETKTQKTVFQKYSLETIKKMKNGQIEEIIREQNSELLNSMLTGKYSNYFLDDLFEHGDSILELEKKLKKIKSVELKYDLTGYVVYIDAGHGNLTAEGKIAPGTNTRNGLDEYHQAYKEALILESFIKMMGGTTIISRGIDGPGASYTKRVAQAERENADIIISMHQNSAIDRSAGGYLSVYEYDNPASIKLAEIMQKRMENLGDILKRNTTMPGDDSEKYANPLGMFRGNLPVILTESAFMSNVEDVALLHSDTYSKTFAANLANTIGEFFSAPASSHVIVLNEDEVVEVEPIQEFNAPLLGESILNGFVSGFENIMNQIPDEDEAEKPSDIDETDKEEPIKPSDEENSDKEEPSKPVEDETNKDESSVEKPNEEQKPSVPSGDSEPSDEVLDESQTSDSEIPEEEDAEQSEPSDDDLNKEEPSDVEQSIEEELEKDDAIEETILIVDEDGESIEVKESGLMAIEENYILIPEEEEEIVISDTDSFFNF